MRAGIAVLAGGSGRRFGAPKLLLPAGPGEVLLTRAVATACSLGSDVLCVLPRSGALHRAALGPPPPGVGVWENPGSEQGMGSSVALAARWAEERGFCSLLLLPADMPGVGPAFLRQLMAVFAAPGDADAAAADVGGRLGAPAVLGPALIAEACRLAGDRGARALLRRPGTHVRAVPLAEPGDIDDFASYRRLAAAHGWRAEQPEEVDWRALPPGETVWSQVHEIWRVGEVLACPLTSAGPALWGWRGQGLPGGARATLFGGSEPPAALGLLRAAALHALRG